MGASKDLFLRISEQEYLSIPADIRSRHLTSKIYSESIQDFDELMLNKDYRDAYQMHKEAKKHLEEITYLLREKRRNSKL